MATETTKKDYPTDDELNHLLLTDDTKPVRQVKDTKSEEPELDLKHLSKKKKPVKLKRKNKKPKKEKKKETRGRPRIWTDEKKAKDLAKRNAKAKEKREAKKEIAQLTKIALNQNFGPAEQKRTYDRVKMEKQALQEEMLKQRETEQRIQSMTTFEQDCNHFDKFSHINMAGYFISTCIHCSRSKTWDPREWSHYWSGVKRSKKK